MGASPTRIVARLGYAARGCVYLLIGGLALQAGLGGGERRGTDLKATLATLCEGPLGLLVVLAIALGLLAYAFWKAVQGVLDADGNGAGVKGLVVRGGMVASAVTHASLGLSALALPFTLDAASHGGTSLDGVLAWLLARPTGRHVLAVLALVVIGAGLSQCWKGWSGGYRRHLAIPPALMDRLAPLCAFGLVARGVVFVIIGGLLLLATPGTAGGTAGALNWLGSQSGGGHLFLVIAAGLVAFGLYGLIQAAGRRVDLAEPPCREGRIWDGARPTIG